MQLFGHDLSFYTLLQEQATFASRASQLLLALTEDFPNTASHAKAIGEVIAASSQKMQLLSERIDSTFVTPLDKEDLHALSACLEDVPEAIHEAAFRVAFYRLSGMRPELRKMAELLTAMTGQIDKAIGSFGSSLKAEIIRPEIARLHALRKEATELFRLSIGELFNAPPPETALVLMWKDIFDRFEKAFEACDAVAVNLEGILVKYA